MITTIVLNSFIKHQNRVINFKPGLNVITGENEAGKSLIMEAICFALFGSQALRKPASTYDQKLDVALELDIQGTGYTVKRTLSTAQILLTSNGTLIAKGTKPVNAEVKKLLGYGFEVFNVANYAAQENIQYLASLKPSERKKVIDNVIGLTAIEKTIEVHKALAAESRAALRIMENQRPEQPNPEHLAISLTLNEVTEANAEYKQKECDYWNYKQAGETRERFLSSKPAHQSEPDVMVLDLTREQHNIKVHTLNVIRSQLNSAKANVVSLENKKIKLEATYPHMAIVDIESLGAKWELYLASERKRKLKDQGHIDCSGCGHRNYFAATSLEGMVLVPDDVEKPPVSQADVQAWINNEAKLEGEKTIVANCEAALAKELDGWPSDRDIEYHFKLLDAHNLYAQYQDRVQQFEAGLDSLPEFDPDVLANKSRELAEAENNYIVLATSLVDAQKAIDLSQALAKWSVVIEAKKAKLAHEMQKLETLDVLLANIKSSLLPRVNAVATGWLQRMSQGMHSKVELDENMDIFVDDDLVEALSISGRALAHLSLRMALGQVLTNSVFPVFMGDEVDSSMRDERSQSVLDNLAAMLKGSVKQVILISHRNLEHDHNVIEV